MSIQILIFKKMEQSCIACSSFIDYFVHENKMTETFIQYINNCYIQHTTQLMTHGIQMPGSYLVTNQYVTLESPVHTS